MLLRGNERIAGKCAEDGDGTAVLVLECGVIDGAGVEEDGPRDNGEADGLAENGRGFKGSLEIGQAIEA